MNRRLFTLLVAIAAMMLCRAEVVSTDRALAVARDFVNQGSHSLKAGAPLKLAYQARSLDGKPDYYVFNNGDDGGFIIVSGDDRTVPVWGYSTSGSFDYESMPENAKWWYSEYQRQLQYLRDNPQVKARKPVKLTTSVAPMLTTEWDQCYPYNMRCPGTPGVYNETYKNKAPTGCTATAMAQIMKKHNWPIVGQGSNRYTCTVKWEDTNEKEHSYDVNLSVDFSKSVYRWNLMQNNYSDANSYTNDQADAVSKLMYDVGIAIGTDYNESGSDANWESVRYAFNNNFRYQTRTYERDFYSGDWDEILRQEIDAGYPIFYRGSHKKNLLNYIGHAFVFDGYNEDGKFHVNWGWGGYEDNYFESSLIEPVLISNSYPNGLQFQYYQVAIVAVPNLSEKNLSSQLSSNYLGTVKKNSRSTSSLSVVGQNLNQDVTISLSGANASMFSTVETVTAAEANAEGGKTVKVIYHPTATGDHTAQITVSAGDDTEPITFTITGNSCVSNDANGDENVDVGDVVAAIQAILNDGTLPFEDFPDVATVVAMINAILNGETTLDIDDGLVAYYPFDGDARDASGHGNHGEVHNVVATHGVNGDTNGAWHFMGYNNPGYIRIPNSESLQFTDGFTFACYVKPLDWSGMNGWGNYSDNSNPNLHAIHCIFAKDHDRRGPYMEINLDSNDNMHVYTGTGGSYYHQTGWAELNSNGKIDGNKLNEWVYIAVTYTKKKACMYINGLKVDERDINADFTEMNRRDFYLGKFSDKWFPFNGVMDEVRIYNRMLTSAEVMELANDNMEAQTQKHPFKLSQKSVTLAVGESVTINMINGTGSYSLGSNTSIVDFDLDHAGASFTLTGISEGNTNVTVIDVNTQTTIMLPVTVKSTLATAVDLGLPSGVKWASCNVGAMLPEEYGGYYAWGEIEEKDVYNWSTYKWCNGSQWSINKYCYDSNYGIIDNITVLEPSDDVATVKWGSSWRMPTKEEQDELRENCDWEWTTINGINGMKVKSRINDSYIFLPACGYRSGSTTSQLQTYGYYQSASLDRINSDDSYYFYFNSSGHYWNDFSTTVGRDVGFSVRPVLAY